MLPDDRLGSCHDCDDRVRNGPGCGISEDGPGSADKKTFKKIIIGLGMGYGFAVWVIIGQDLTTRNPFASVLMDPNDLVSFIYLVTLGMAVLFIIVFELRSKE